MLAEEGVTVSGGCCIWHNDGVPESAIFSDTSAKNNQRVRVGNLILSKLYCEARLAAG